MPRSRTPLVVAAATMLALGTPILAQAAQPEALTAQTAQTQQVQQTPLPERTDTNWGWIGLLGLAGLAGLLKRDRPAPRADAGPTESAATRTSTSRNRG